MKENTNREKQSKRRKQVNEVRKNFGTEAGEDATKYGEFVCSYFAWLTPNEQKINAEKLENMTKE